MFISKNSLRRRDVLLGAGACALFNIAGLHHLAAADSWKKVKAFGVELEVPAQWTRFEYRRPSEDHNEIQFAENRRNIAEGAWFSVFPDNGELLDPDRTEQPFVVDGRPARLTDMLTRADDPPPRRRQIVIYFTDSQMPGFLFDGNSEQWSTLGPILDRIVASIRLPKR